MCAAIGNGQVIQGPYERGSALVSTISSGGGRPLVSSHLPLHKRGPLAAAERRCLPPAVSRQIGTYVGILSEESQRDVLSLSADILGLLNAPAVRAYVLEDWRGKGVARWAAVASRFVAEVRQKESLLLGRYVRDLLPCVAGAVAPAVRIFRLPRGGDFHRAVNNLRRDELRLSLLGPLALFFLESVARAEAAWNVLVEPENAPSRPAAFGWAPSLDSMTAAMRPSQTPPPWPITMRATEQRNRLVSPDGILPPARPSVTLTKSVEWPSAKVPCSSPPCCTEPTGLENGPRRELPRPPGQVPPGQKAKVRSSLLEWIGPAAGFTSACWPATEV